MLKFSTYSGVWIPTIFLLVVSVARTKMCNITNTIDYSPRHYHRNHWYREQLSNSNIFLSSTHDLRDFMNQSLSDTYLYDPLPFVELFEGNKSKSTIEDLDELRRQPQNTVRNNAGYAESVWIPNSFVNVINYHENATHYAGITSSFASNGTSPSLLRRSEETPWKRRTLCAVFDDGKNSAEKLLPNDIPGDENEKESAGEEKTLLSYDGPVFMNDMENSDSLKPHIRVKRGRSDSNPGSSFMFQQDYLKDLANSFPRNSYESIDENSDYDDEVSFETKREVKLQDEQSVGSIDQKVENEDDQSKISDAYPFAIFPSPSSGDKEYVSVTNQQSQDRNSEILSPSDDPMLTVELVRKKRNNYGRAENKQSLEEIPLLPRPSDEQITGSISSETNQKGLTRSNVKTEESFDDENPLVGPEKYKRDSSADRQRPKPSSLAMASLKADLLRLKRRAKNDHRHEKRSKTKKKRKHVEKKHDTPRSNSPRSSKTVRSKNAIRSRALRKRKNSETRSEGKSNVRIASKLVPKTNNENNFRRRSVKAKKSIERTDSENDRSPIGARLENIDENKINGDNTELSLVARGGGEVSDLKAGSDESEDAVPVENGRSMMPREDETKLRAKRDKSAAGKHGFLNEEDELRYYQHIREPEPETAQGGGRRGSEVEEADGGRAARSIEEVRELAKKLVTKVNELENFLNVDEAKNKGGEKRIETRAIDDLCSNVTTACAVFKEAPKIVQRCPPSKATSHESTTTTTSTSTSTSRIVVEKRAEPSRKVDERVHFRGRSGKSVEKKRSTRERVVRTSSSTSKTVRRESENTGRKWGRWTDWSSCSVTCGKGRQIRWRYCLRDCSMAETEMEEKGCQLPACPPGKFLGIF